MKIPNLQEAQKFLDDAQEYHSGSWMQHSIVVAEAARAIANVHPGINPEFAYILGLLHDIGRQEGISCLRHIIDGYRFLHERGFDDAARICLTHSFPTKDVKVVAGTWDCPRKDEYFTREYLAQISYTIYDKLIVLCDSISLPSGFCLLEKRLLDVALRYGVNEYTQHKWKATFGLQREFEAVLGQSIYHLLPGVVENTFGFNSSSRQRIEVSTDNIIS